ncbi:2,5-diamino-6-(ribosylamino)-4(3H)-pyrimidinone 5'-phosphate reductase [Coemansia sp. IMI 203386]|nr:2,5-diamino-6-(ribosylamino)-4(3H)-pyrimidinone 5'-phosphate reductase [Coemansia sp. IMI 203386]
MIASVSTTDDNSCSGASDNNNSNQARAFVCRAVDFSRAQTKSNALYVTLTFAQSLDGKISLPGQQLLLSGSQAMSMTHHLRATHDGILVGVGTVLTDDPRLNARLVLPVDSPGHPRPVILDPRLRFPLSARLLQNPQHNMPWIVAGPDHDRCRRAELEALGVCVVIVDHCDSEGRPLVSAVLQALAQKGIRRLMVEGGAQIIQAFLESQLVDSLIITIAPTLVGSRGVPAVPAPNGIQTLKITPRVYEQFGADVVLAADTD